MNLGDSQSLGEVCVILLLNGAFGIGKSTVARALVARLPGSMLYDPEIIGILLQRAARLSGYRVGDFQDLRAWRWLTVLALRIARLWSATIIVPTAFSNPGYLAELRDGIARFEPELLHFCLVAPVDVVHARLRGRGADPERHAWQYRRASECCAVHGTELFAARIDATGRTPEELADQLLARIAARMIAK